MKSWSFNDQNKGEIFCDAGLVLEQLNQELEPYKLITPYNLGAKGSCTLGGNVATLAGGINYVHYGSLRNYVQGLEVVTGNGKILNMMRWSQKDNTGIDLKQVFIGSEGQLGIITQVGLVCPRSKPFRATSFLRVKSFSSVLQMLYSAKEKFGSSLYSIEYLDFESYMLVIEELNKTRIIDNDPLTDSLQQFSQLHYDSNYFPINDSQRDYYLLIELSGDSDSAMQDLLLEFLENQSSLVEDGRLIENESQREQVWEVRESVVVATAKRGNVLKYDVSLPCQYFQDLVDHVRTELQHKQNFTSGYGHIGDGNLHLNVCLNKESAVSTSKQFPYS
jgi:FAD/FMN-containing dehydrogenase